jgi:membrane protease YdiL (CAAX protease family)
MSISNSSRTGSTRRLFFDRFKNRFLVLLAAATLSLSAVVYIIIDIVLGYPDHAMTVAWLCKPFLLLVGVVAAVKFMGLRLKALFGPVPRTLHAWSLALGTAAGTYFFVQAEGSLLLPLLEEYVPLAAEWYVSSYVSEPKTTAWGLIRLALIVPIMEEILHRGLIYQRWSHAWGRPITALVASSALFAVLHGNVMGAFVFAALATVAYTRTGSLWVPIAAHGMYNAQAAVGGLGTPDLIEFVFRPVNQTEFGVICGFVFLVVIAGVWKLASAAEFIPIPYSANVDATSEPDVSTTPETVPANP